MDFMENYSPVVNNAMLSLLLIAKMIFGLSSKIVYMETVFLYGDLEEEIFMDWPPGMEDVTDENTLLLDQCIYGLV